MKKTTLLSMVIVVMHLVVGVIVHAQQPGKIPWIGYLARSGYDSQQTQEAADPNRPANLWEPVAGDHGAHGDFDSRAKGRSVQWWLTSHRRAVFGAALGAAGALVVGKTRK